MLAERLMICPHCKWYYSIAQIVKPIRCVKFTVDFCGCDLGFGIYFAFPFGFSYNMESIVNKMSKFAEKLQRVYRGAAAPMGFRKSTEAEPPPLLVIANLTKAGAAEAKAIADAGIDAAILDSGGLSARSFGQLSKAIDDVPLGLFLGSAEKEEITQSIDLGCDFVVFGLKTPLEAVSREDMGKLLRIEPSLDLGLVRAINELPLMVDGVLVAGEESSVTVERLLICQRFTELLTKPVLVTVNLSVTSAELSSLFQAGVNGLVLPERVPAETFAEMKKMIAGLPKAAKRKSKGAALLPRLGGGLGAEVQEEEEEEEEEE
jgi:hypothetical protein